MLICYPFGQEYIRAHRACLHLTTKIATAGFAAMRFDYFGTGDSGGESNEASLEQWLGDIDTACEELINRSGATSVVLVGLRLGASLAFQAAARRSDLAGLVLWEPIVNSADYVAALKRLHTETIARFFVAPTDRVLGANPTEMLGFPLGETMLTEIEQIDLGQLRAPRGRPVMVIDNGEIPGLADVSGRANYANIARSLLKDVVWYRITETGFRVRQALSQRQPVREDSAEAKTKAHLRGIVERGVALIFIHSEGSTGQAQVHAALGDEIERLKVASKIQEVVIPQSDHLFTLMARQQLVNQTLAEWTQTHWSAVPAPV